MTTVSLVTGAAGAMGSACARAIAGREDVLLLTDRREAALLETTRQIEREAACRVVPLVGDLTDQAFRASLVESLQQHGRLRSVVHAAGVTPTGYDWRQILRVDLTSVARLLEALGSIAERGSVAVCVASVSGHMGDFAPAMDAVLDDCLAPDFEQRFASALGGQPHSGDAYRLAKRGVIRLCEREAVRWGARGGRVVSISPGLMDTEMGRVELREQPVKPQLVTLTPIHSARVGDDSPLPGHLEDIADAAAFLCSPGASFISGCDLRVDGGLLATLNQQG